MLREQGDTKIDLGSMKNYFGEHQKHNSGSREKRVKFQREPGAGDPPLRGLKDGAKQEKLWWKAYMSFPVYIFSYPIACEWPSIYPEDFSELNNHSDEFIKNYVMYDFKIRLDLTLVRPSFKIFVSRPYGPLSYLPCHL